MKSCWMTKARAFVCQRMTTVELRKGMTTMSRSLLLVCAFILLAAEAGRDGRKLRFVFKDGAGGVVRPIGL